MSILKKTVFLDHDGGVDDLLALLLLLTMDEAELIGINVTPADCYADPAAEASRKFLTLMGQPDVEVAISKARGINAFPDNWRAQPQIINAFPQLLNTPDAAGRLSPKEGSQFIIEKLMEATEAVSYLMTGPCTTLVHALHREPAIRQKIKEVVWMAGAFHVHGNVRTYTHNGAAEWNVFWDAASAQWLISQNLPLIMVPLDATNQVPVEMDFLHQMAEQAHFDVANLASHCWAVTVNTIPGYDYLYHMWDVLATAYIGRPAYFRIKEMEISVSTKAPNEGDTNEQSGSGNFAQIVKRVDRDAFYKYLLQQSRRNFKSE